MSAYMQYEHDSGIIARWHGGAYIELGYITNPGVPGMEAEFHAFDVINVYDYAKGEAEITTLAQMQEVVDDHLRPCADCGEVGVENRDEWDEYLCDFCYDERVADEAGAEA